MRSFWRQWHGHLLGLEKIDTADRLPNRVGA